MTPTPDMQEIQHAHVDPLMPTAPKVEYGTVLKGLDVRAGEMLRDLDALRTENERLVTENRKLLDRVSRLESECELRTRLS